ncbi:hypothetical protein EDS67_03580 [candidate division KSB1 bacterium]|nr:MAG: hypothetical protein EDS67_03580 [candidate division KSB1 bacterium]MBC6951101.1 hypothetical protein [candidate division KSB1 bacterium]MCE7940007.1 hypothetical protein [Chlorobi bacterium CHB1]MDL1876642.1 hypothetical protein [Cytophagia bacterium CHB2]RIK73876.1 MAG: hypothetical protein DCC62_16415 [candidate division KSB1 bacterium]
MKKYALIVLACVTLGLAPFVPEPHIVGKLRWILGGGRGMELIDWWDTLQHGAPWLILLYFVTTDLIKKITRRKDGA